MIDAPQDLKARQCSSEHQREPSEDGVNVKRYLKGSGGYAVSIKNRACSTATPTIWSGSENPFCRESVSHGT